MAARVGFDVSLLENALPEAEKLLERWVAFMPTEMDMGGIIQGRNVAMGARVFTRQLWQSLPLDAPAGAGSYCLYAHAAAAFVVARFWPLVHNMDSVASVGPVVHGGDDSSRHDPTRQRSLYVRVRRRERGPLPRRVVREPYMMLNRALLNFGFGRMLDQASLMGWPIGSAEIVELAETFRTVCLVPGDGCTLLRWEKAVNSRLRRMVRFSAGAAVWDPADDVMVASHSIALMPAALGGPAVGTTAEVEPQPKKLWAFFVGTHGAIVRELINSWNTAIKSEGSPIREVLIHEIFQDENYVYSSEESLKNLGAQQLAQQQRTCEGVLNELAYAVIYHSYLSPATIPVFMRGALHKLLAEFTRTDSAVFVCSIPAVLCVAFASLTLPVIHYSPTSLVVQVPLENVAPWLKIYAKMAEDPKNHFVANTGAYGAGHEALIGRRLPIIPVMAFYINNSFAGQRSAQVLVFSRAKTLMHEAICSLVPRDFPLRFVSHMHTDRQFSTFARHRAVVFNPGAWTQMAFWELYAMGLPPFIPADPGRFLWPPIPAALAHGAIVTGPEHARPWRGGGHGWKTFARWRGSHVLKSFLTSFPGSVTEVIMTVTFNSTNLAGVKVQVGDESVQGLASIVPLSDGMDLYGNTHALIPAGDGWGGPRAPYFLSSRCLRLHTLLGAVGGTIGPVLAGSKNSCANVTQDFANWRFWYPLHNEGAMMDKSDLRADGAVTSAFGETFWYFGQTRLSHRRRQTQPTPRWDPFTISRHSSLRRLLRDVDMFQFPHVGRFLSVADLLRQLTRMQPIPTSKGMRDFMRTRRAAGLGAWRGVLFAVVAHPSQDNLLNGKP
eukprot:TRINITY_DN9850_c0_g1_i1.p1 TRINITY_DN9850_c0_g1~~TRINITY_DN9850_c0_g1_i1.p1  ORF type:complete len:926 (+),score=76.80 TRINITY_DN9850_c0_g1_i1:274-2778(+)